MQNWPSLFLILRSTLRGLPAIFCTSNSSNTKIVRLSSLDETDILDVLYRLIRKISFVNEAIIPDEIRQEAYQLTTDIDPKDAPFVALALYTEAPLWTGDRKLLDRLRAKGFMRIMGTADLLDRLKLSR